jgi:hypothetical protein
VGGFVGMNLIGLLNAYTMKLQIAAKIKAKGEITSYSELGGAVMGPVGKTFIDVCMVMA